MINNPFSDTDCFWFEPLNHWYGLNARALPWRETNDAYRIWVSEVMLQQTRVGTVLRYYEPFVDAFPTLESLAMASLESIMKRWQGLGYYRRAEFLQKGCQKVLERFGGRIPQVREDLIQIPGIGEYMASSISSIAFQKPYLALDGNIARLISRIVASDKDILNAKVQKTIRDHGNRCMERAKKRGLLPGFLNQACMDLASSLCLPKNPSCRQCPIINQCRAYQEKRIDDIPVRKQTKQRKTEWVEIGMVYHSNKILIQKRKGEGILSNLWGYPIVERTPDKSPGDLIRSYLSQLGKSPSIFAFRFLGQAEHRFTHKEWIMDIYRIELQDCFEAPTQEECLWVCDQEMDQYAIPVAFQKVRNLDRSYHFDTPSIPVVAAIMENKKREVLIAQRPIGSDFPGFWEFPGGKVQPGETNGDALVREIYEELGVKVSVGPLTFQTVYQYPRRKVHLFFYLCTPYTTNFRLKAHDQVLWVPIDQIGSFPFLPADIKAIQWITRLLQQVP